MAFDKNAAEDQSYGHKPVLLDECLEALAIRPDGIYLDGTLGRAGHSLEIARRLTEGGRLIGVDRDETALAAAEVRLAEFRDRVTLVHSNFSCIHQILDELGLEKIDGMLFDLGVSSLIRFTMSIPNSWSLNSTCSASYPVLQRTFMGSCRAGQF